MTANQIAYQNMLETHRSNVARETETYRSNVTKERETQRHNLLTEGIARDTLSETVRHNKAGEQEVKRHNVQTERLGWSTLGEQIRHNQVSEGLDSQRIQIQKQQADTAQFDAETRRTKQQQDYTLGYTQQSTNRINADTQRMSVENQKDYNDSMVSIGWTNAIWGNINNTAKAVSSFLSPFGSLGSTWGTGV